MKKVFYTIIAMSSILFLTACGGNANNYDNSVTPKLGDTVIMDGFEVTLEGYRIGKAIDPREEIQDLIYLDVKVKNTGSKATRLSESKFTVYNPNNTKIKIISSSKYTTSITALANIRPNGEASTQIIFPFQGYGTYYIEFAGVNGMVTAEIDIKE